MLIGILAGLATGAFWGLTFVAPRAVQPYSEIDLAILRYLAFGMTSLALMLVSPRFRPGRMDLKTIAMAIWLGLSGYVIYYFCVAFSITLAGPAIAPLVIGALPLLLTVYGNWQDRNVAWSRIVMPMLLIASGLIVVNASTLANAPSPQAQQNIVLGFLVALGGMLVWFLYAITNARVMRSANAPSLLGWTSLQGLGAMVGILPFVVLAPVLGWSRIPELGFGGEAGTRLILWALLTGILASWVAQYFWSLASSRLPLALSAQMIVSETIFALIYGFAYEGRWPYLTEWLGGSLLIAGVIWGVTVFSAKSVGDPVHS